MGPRGGLGNVPSVPTFRNAEASACSGRDDRFLVVARLVRERDCRAEVLEGSSAAVGMTGFLVRAGGGLGNSNEIGTYMRNYTS